MRIGLTLPTFESSPAAALGRAAQAERAGVDGVFVFDHLWPGADRSRPSLSALPLLAGVAAVTRDISVGTLVFRLGLVPDEVILRSTVSLGEIAGDRLIAGLGMGDAKGAAENYAYGIDLPPLGERRTSLATLLSELSARSIETWVGATAPATITIARNGGAAVNLWEAGLDELSVEAQRGPTTWAGPIVQDPVLAARWLRALRDAGAAWAVWAWPRSVEIVSTAIEMAGMGERT